MRRSLPCALALLLCPCLESPAQEARAPAAFTLEQILSAPCPSSLVAAPRGQRIAWVLEQAGRKTIQVAEGPEFEARELLAFAGDDGQALALIGFSPDGEVLVFARGSRFNPASRPAGAPGRKLYRIGWAGGEARELARADTARLSPTDATAVFVRDGALWRVELSGSEKARPAKLFTCRGSIGSPRWSPDGRRIAFTSARQSAGQRYSWIGCYDLARRELRYLDAAVDRDSSPRWSPDGKRIAFVRRLGGARPGVLLARELPREDPWELRIVTPDGGAARSVLRRPELIGGSRLACEWLDEETLVLRSERDGWARLYLLAAARGRLRPLSPRRAEVETFRVAAGQVYFVTNAADPERRHIWVGSRRGAARQLTRGETIEWSPVPTGDGAFLAHLASTARRPAHVRVLPAAGGSSRMLAAGSLPEDFPLDHLVVPQPVTFTARDGTRLHGQLFSPPERSESRRPAVIFLHGGPMRQMLLGWHYRSYYHRCYAFNQFLAQRGFHVLALNYRLGIGYGRAFREVPDGGPRGASEYQDVLAAAAYLRALPAVDPGRIGLWGGSYGGYLTALGLARNSDLFAAGVDFHGVHDWGTWQRESGGEAGTERDRIAWKASPEADVQSWRSPVLLVHGDDDRNVPFGESVRLAHELRQRGVTCELLVLPDEVHSFLRHASWVRAFAAAADFFERKLLERASVYTPIRTGSARYEFELDGVVLQVFTYKPASYRGERMITVLHGTLRNADEYRDDARAMGDRFGALIVAPRFDRKRFPSRKYHYGGILNAAGQGAPPDEWTYRFIPLLAAAVRRMERRPEMPYWLIGHSAGGQFVARLSAFQATGAVRHVAANPGSELFPTREWPFGYGFGELPRELSDDAALRRYLGAPLTLYLGTADDHPDNYFDASPVALLQGAGRYQRGKACFERARALAQEKGWAFAWRLVEAPGVAHDHTEMFNHPSCAEALFGR